MASGNAPQDDFDLDIRVVPQEASTANGRSPWPTGLRCMTPWCAPSLNCTFSQACG